MAALGTQGGQDRPQDPSQTRKCLFFICFFCIVRSESVKDHMQIGIFPNVWPRFRTSGRDFERPAGFWKYGVQFWAQFENIMTSWIYWYFFQKPNKRCGGWHARLVRKYHISEVWGVRRSYRLPPDREIDFDSCSCRACERARRSCEGVRRVPPCRWAFGLQLSGLLLLQFGLRV